MNQVYDILAAMVVAIKWDGIDEEDGSSFHQLMRALAMQHVLVNVNQRQILSSTSPYQAYRTQ